MWIQARRLVAMGLVVQHRLLAALDVSAVDLGNGEKGHAEDLSDLSI